VAKSLSNQRGQSVLLAALLCQCHPSSCPRAAI
jgi:hypothetical protein